MYKVDDPEDIIPFDDTPAEEPPKTVDDEQILRMKREKESLLKQISEADDELYQCKNALTSALWELNDLGNTFSK